MLKEKGILKIDDVPSNDKKKGRVYVTRVRKDKKKDEPGSESNTH